MTAAAHSRSKQARYATAHSALPSYVDLAGDMLAISAVSMVCASAWQSTGSVYSVILVVVVKVGGTFAPANMPTSVPGGGITLQTL